MELMFRGQQLVDAMDGVVGDAGEHFPQIGFGIEAVSFAEPIER